MKFAGATETVHMYRLAELGLNSHSDQNKTEYYYMARFPQFGLNLSKRGQTHLSQLHVFLDPDAYEDLTNGRRMCFNV